MTDPLRSFDNPNAVGAAIEDHQRKARRRQRRSPTGPVTRFTSEGIFVVDEQGVERRVGVGPNPWQQREQDATTARRAFEEAVANGDMGKAFEAYYQLTDAQLALGGAGVSRFSELLDLAATKAASARRAEADSGE